MLLIALMDHMGKEDKVVVDIMGRGLVEVTDKEQVPTMDRVTRDMEDRVFHKEIGEMCREINGTIAQEDQTR